MVPEQMYRGKNQKANRILKKKVLAYKKNTWNVW